MNIKLSDRIDRHDNHFNLLRFLAATIVIYRSISSIFLYRNTMEDRARFWYWHKHSAWSPTRKERLLFLRGRGIHE